MGRFFYRNRPTPGVTACLPFYFALASAAFSSVTFTAES